jgi:hypothetical protein
MATLRYIFLIFNTTYNFIVKNNRHVSSTDKIADKKLYRNQGNLFAIDDANDDDANESDEESKKDPIPLDLWLKKPDTVNHFKCFYRVKHSNSKHEWVPGYYYYL